MTDLEAHLTRLLHNAVDDIDIPHDPATFATSRRSGQRGRWVAVVLAGAALIVLCTGLVLVRSVRQVDTPSVEPGVVTSPPSTPPAAVTSPPSTPPAAVTSPPATGLPDNGVIVTNDGNTGWQQVDPSGAGRTVTDLPSPSDGFMQPVVSNDGTRIAYVIDRTVKVRDIATGAERDVARCAPDILCSIAISPDGATVAFNPDPSSIALIDADSGIDQVADVILQHTMFVSVVGWTHDGERIVFIPNMNREIDTDASLEAVSVDGADRTTILSSRDFPDTFQAWWFDVSPRDSTIGWVQMNPLEDLTEGSRRDRDGQPFSLQLRLVDIDGSDQRVVADLGDCWCIGFSPDFTWSPDGLQYAYLVSTGGSQVNNLLVASASEISDPTSVGSGSGEMVWFPDTA